MREFSIDALHNRYYLMRHGKSRANDKGLIVSSPDYGVSDWGLSPGAESAITQSIERSGLQAGTLIYSSDFLRARQSAEIAVRQLHAGGEWDAMDEGVRGGELVLEVALRERFFGSYDMDSDKNYSRVWAQDASGPDSETNEEFGVESPESVLERLLDFIARIESQQRNKQILIVSHGDPLDILLAAASGLPSFRHREIRAMETAEIRSLHSG